MGSHLLLYRAFLQPFLPYVSPGWFSFLNVANATKLERLYRAVSRTITDCLSSSPIPFLLSEASLPPLRVTLIHLALSSYEWVLCLPIFLPISDLPRLGVKPQLSRSSWRAFSSTHLLMPSSTSPREVLLACPLYPLWNPPSCSGADSFYFILPPSPFFSRQGAALAQLDSFPPDNRVILTDGFARFPFGKDGSGDLANCSLCGAEITLSFSEDPVCLSFSAKVCKLSIGLSSTNMSAFSLLPSSTVALSSLSTIIISLR